MLDKINLLEDKEQTPGAVKKSRIMSFCRLIYHPYAQKFILILIVLNSVILGLETSKTLYDKIGPVLVFIDHFCLAVFCFELALKIIYEKHRFFMSGWNVFDLLIVGISLVPGTDKFTVLRSLRILRAMRLIVKLPRLRVVVDSIIHALPSIGWISILLSVIIYIFAILVTNIFGPTFPDWFGTLGASMYTLFQIMTLESWSMGIVRPVMDAFPYGFLLFIPFICAPWKGAYT
jgi:voltage-gated sodium channel